MRHLTLQSVLPYLLAVLALLSGFAGSPVRLALSMFWLLLGAALVAAGAATRRDLPAPLAPLRLGAEVLLAVATLFALAEPACSLPPAALGVPGKASTGSDGPRQTNGVSWRAAFTAPNQAMMKVIPVPFERRGQPLLVRVDLGSDYQGSAGFTLEVNDVRLGTLSRQASGTSYLGGRAGPYWARRVPQGFLSGPEARVVLRPVEIDTALTVAGHADPQIEPLGRRNSWFFDGAAWRSDLLAGPASPATGAYRIWLVP